MTEEREIFLFLFYRKTCNLENFGGDWTLLSCTKRSERDTKKVLFGKHTVFPSTGRVSTPVNLVSSSYPTLHIFAAFSRLLLLKIPLFLAQERKEAFFLEKSVHLFVFHGRTVSPLFFPEHCLEAPAGWEFEIFPPCPTEIPFIRRRKGLLLRKQKYGKLFAVCKRNSWHIYLKVTCQTYNNPCQHQSFLHLEIFILLAIFISGETDVRPYRGFCPTLTTSDILDGSIDQQGEEKSESGIKTSPQISITPCCCLARADFQQKRFAKWRILKIVFEKNLPFFYYN